MTGSTIATQPCRQPPDNHDLHLVGHPCVPCQQRRSTKPTRHQLNGGFEAVTGVQAIITVCSVRYGGVWYHHRVTLVLLEGMGNTKKWRQIITREDGRDRASRCRYSVVHVDIWRQWGSTRRYIGPRWRRPGFFGVYLAARSEPHHRFNTSPSAKHAVFTAGQVDQTAFPYRNHNNE